MPSHRLITVSGGREGPDDKDPTAPSLASLGLGMDHHVANGDPDVVARLVLDVLLRTQGRIQAMLEHAVAGRWYASDRRGDREMRDLSGWTPPADVVEDARLALAGQEAVRDRVGPYCGCVWRVRDGRRQAKVSGCDRHPSTPVAAREVSA